MNRITNLFQTQKDGILSVYFTAGYPNLNDTASILKALQAKGIHMVEVGIPFSDPMADGPVIQEAATQALRNGMSLHLLFEQLKEIRSEVQIPIILMGYLNPIMQYGFEKFCESCIEAGVDGMIIPDLPYADYISDYKEIADRHDLKMIMLITPRDLRGTNPADRCPYQRIYLYGIQRRHDRSPTRLQRTKAGLFPSYQRHEPTESPLGRFRHQQ